MANRAENMPSERKREILGVIVLGLTALLFLAVVSDGFQTAEGAKRPIEGMSEVPNLLRGPGAYAAGFLAILIGDAAHIIYSLFFIWGMMLIAHRPLDRFLTRLAGFITLGFASAGLMQVLLEKGVSNPAQPGGIIGAFIADTMLVPYFGTIGSAVVGVTFAIIGILLATDFLFVHLILLANQSIVHLIRGNLALADVMMVTWYRLQKIRAERANAIANRKKKIREILKSTPAMPEPVIETHALTEDVPAQVPNPVIVDHRMRSRQELSNITAPEAQELPFDAVPGVAEKSQAPKVQLQPEQAFAFDKPSVFIAPKSAAPPSPAPAPAPVKTVPTPEPIPEPVAEVEQDVYDVTEMRQEAKLKEAELSDTASDKPKERFDPAGLFGASVSENVEVKTSPAPRRPRLKRDDEFVIDEDYQYPKVYTDPPLTLFLESDNKEVKDLSSKLRSTGNLLEETLKTFGIEARVTDVTRGPTITRFELEPAPGIKVSKFMQLADDIALALKAHRVRVEAPIPGKGRVGIEVPNLERDQVLIRELLECHKQFKKKGILDLALGKDITGDIVFADLCKMPHLLVAGATGAGKTVCVKSLLATMLCTRSPDELQLMLIDPKMVELSIFNDIPHLITPVVTEAKKAATALSWLINEMEERYRLFADLRVRNLEVYNESVDNGEIRMEGEEEGEEESSVHLVRKLPYIVCVIDELADLMILARAEVEDAIARLAQLARAVGIHLIIATQRPSVDVLTGVIKANFPARISFQVSSRIDSKCILDEIGAERLIGMGDMLYLPAGQSKPTRIQGAFVSDEEMAALIKHLKTQAPPQYRDEIQHFGKESSKLESMNPEDDPLYEDAVQVVMDTGQASISMVQRKLRVGYTRAARLVDMMEVQGIVGPHTGSKARDILVDTISRKDEVA